MQAVNWSGTMNLERIGNPTYWFLYEGTPGGGLDPADDFVLRPDGIRTALTEPWTGSVSWVCFGARESRHGLLLINQQNPEPGQPTAMFPGRTGRNLMGASIR